jgi:signal peptidase I
MNRRTATRTVTATLSVALLASGWLLLAPSHLGGWTRYAIVEGSSMEPALSRGDLAVVRSSGKVGVGDVVLYRDSDLGVEVLHRVTALDGHRLVLQGDSNDFLDDARPTAADVAGSLWFSVPHAGSAVAWMREPLHAALLVFVLTLLALTGSPPSGLGLRGAASQR